MPAARLCTAFGPFKPATRLLTSLLATFLLGVSVASTLAVAESTDIPEKIEYSRDVRPILSERCYTCHGPDESKRQAGLRLDVEQDARKKLESGGFAIVAGHADQSLLLTRALATDEAERMPPAESGPPLKPREIEILRRWIAAGAEWKGHWSYLPIVHSALPAVNDPSWPRNGIDYFILSKLDRQSLKPTQPAEKTALLRRVTLDLTGLPPTLPEIDAFLADTSDGAYERVVDRLLASPHYGERMALKWLDLSRYADTNGYHVDDHRNIWKYRDWVINAFNRNLPFDQFTIEQLAGDLLPSPTVDQRVASGFHRNVMVTSEGGADPEEYLTKYAGDRVATTGTVWLGSTLACTECHDHKYDPFTQQDFYKLYAYFNNIPELGLDTRQGSPVPNLRIPTPEQEAKLADLRRLAAELETRITGEVAKAVVEPASQAPMFDEYVWVDDAVPEGATPAGNEEQSSWHWTGSPAPVVSGLTASERTAQGFGQHYFTGAKQPLTIVEGDKFFAHVYLDPNQPPQSIMLQFHSGGWEHRAYWGITPNEVGADGSPSRLRQGDLPALGRWVRLEVDAAAVGFAPGAVIDGLAFSQLGGHLYWDKAGVVNRTPAAERSSESEVAWQKALRAKPDEKLPNEVKEAVKVEPAQQNEAQRKTLRDYFVRYVYSKSRPVFAPLNEQLSQLRKAESDLDKAVPVTMVMQENEKPRDTFVLMRGDFRSKGQQVKRGIPSSLPPLPAGAPDNRLGLAQWLVDPANPLVARVTVNRYWQQYFGTGIVKTSDDFGSRGEWPVHAELLDWLASTFIESGWDIKGMQRLIVTSAAYRQSSHVDAKLVERDPENRLLARGPRFRLDAEMIRDNALATSGLMTDRLGGPSVSPVQPAGLWDELTAGDRYVQSQGADLYRRGLYVYLKRSVPYPPLVTFDAPNREVCTDSRPRTNTPLQALVLLNDPVYVEAARVFGQRILREGGADVAARLAFAFRLSTARAPSEREAAILRKLYDENLTRFQQNAEAAKKLISIGDAPRPAGVDPAELATWTAIGNVLLNLDETITKG